MGSTSQDHFAGFSSASPFGTQVLDKGKVSKGGLLPAILGGLGSAFLGPAGPILGSIVGAGLNFGLNRIESGIQNRYNSPKNVLKRLAEAGLPAAAYLKGAGNQSATSSATFAQPDLGTAEAISREQINRMQKQQFELMKREMNLKEAQQRLAEANAYKSEVWGDYFGRTPGDFAPISNFGQMIQTQNRLRDAQRFLTENKNVFQELENKVEKALVDENIPVEKEREGLKILKERVPLMRVQKALMSQQVQESISRVIKNQVSIEAMYKQMSVAEQTVRIRQLQEEFNQAFLNDVKKDGKITTNETSMFKFLQGLGFIKY